MSRPPVIGITSGPQIEDAGYGTVHRYRLSSDYTRAVEAAGGVPVILPLHSSSISGLLEVLDGARFLGRRRSQPCSLR